MADLAPAQSRTRTALMVMSLCLNVGLIALILVGIGRVGNRFIAQPGTLGMNGGNLKIVRRPPTPAFKPAKPVSYERPSGFRKGVRDQVWENARGADGHVRNPGNNEIMDPNKPWDMGHKPGYEFRKHQQSAIDRGISRKQFLDEHNDPSHYRPELPSYNRSHAGEDMTGDYLGS